MIVFPEDINISESEKNFIALNLPIKYETVIKEVDPANDMEVFFKINLKTIEETNIWVSQFQEQTNTTYSVHNTRKCAGERLTYKKFYKCHHNTRRKETYDPVYRKHVKNTKCPSFLMVNMRVTGKRYRGKNQNDKPDPDKPCEIKVKLYHNHSLTDGMASKFRRVLPEIRNELINLYKQGHTPATALQRLKSDIRLNYENHADILIDRSKCPDYRFCHYIYDRYIVKAPEAEQIILNEEFLENKLESYNNVMGDDCAKMVMDETGYVMCFCPPFVKRIHQFNPSASTVAFIYSSSISDKNGSKIYILLTYCEIGAVPLGVIISSSKSVGMLYTGFTLLKDLLGEVAFGGNLAGPEYFIVEETLGEENILNTVWPKSTVLFGVCFVLKNIWKNLNSRTNISTDDKFVLFTDFYNLVYAVNELDLITKYENAKNSKYEYYLKLVTVYWEKRKLWALCYRTTLSLRGNNTTEKYSENIFRIMKTNDLLRIKSFNTFQLVDFIINNFFLFFENRLLDAANSGNIINILEVKDTMPCVETLQKIKILGNNIHFVPEEELMYVVDTDLLTCTCIKGYPTTICKHIQWMCTLVHPEIFTLKKINISEILSNYYQILNQIVKEDASANYDYEDSESNNYNSDELIVEAEDINIFNLKNDIFFEDAIVVQVTETNKEETINEGKESWKKMTEIFENFLYNSPEEVSSAAKEMLTNFQNITSVSDFCSYTKKVPSPTNREVAAATKLLLLSSGNAQSVSNEVVVNTPKDGTASPLQTAKTNESGMKRIILLSGNIIQGPDEKKIKLIPIQNSTIVSDTNGTVVNNVII